MKSKPKPTESEPMSGAFQKVAECLYRHKSSGMYYGLVKRSGKQYRRSLKTTDRKLAERFIGEFRQKIDRLDHTKARSNITFAECAKLWLATVVPQLKPSSALRRETSVGQILPYLGSTTVRNLTATTCESWAGKRGPGVAASTYNNERDTIIGILNYAKREGLLLDNQALVLRRRKMGRTNIVIPSKAEFEKLVRTLHGLDVRYQPGADLVELLAYSGMRLAEATGLRWQDVDFANNRFMVTGGDVGTKNNEERIVPLFPAMRAFLERLAQRQGHEPGSLIISIRKATKAMQKACTLADLPSFTHHSMRHYFVSNAIEAGVDFKTIAGWVGHKDGGLLVAKTYGHLRDTHSFEMAKRMTFAANS